MFNFVIINLKKHNLWPNYATSGHQNRKSRSTESGESQQRLAILKICY